MVRAAHVLGVEESSRAWYVSFIVTNGQAPCALTLESCLRILQRESGAMEAGSLTCGGGIVVDDSVDS